MTEKKEKRVRPDLVAMGLLHFVGFVLLAYLLDPRETFPSFPYIKNIDLLKFWMTSIQVALSALIIVLGIGGVWVYHRMAKAEDQIEQLQTGHLELKEKLEQSSGRGKI